MSSVRQAPGIRLTVATVAIAMLGVLVGPHARAEAQEADRSLSPAAPAPKFAALGPVAPTPDSGISILDTNCANGYGCFWTQDNFQGTKRIWGTSFCCGWQYVWFDQSFHHSVKNRFDNRKLLIGNALYTLDCLNPPNANRTNPPRFDRYRIGQPGSRC